MSDGDGARPYSDANRGRGLGIKTGSPASRSPVDGRAPCRINLNVAESAPRPNRAEPRKVGHPVQSAHPKHWGDVTGMESLYDESDKFRAFVVWYENVHALAYFRGEGWTCSVCLTKLGERCHHSRWWDPVFMDYVAGEKEWSYG